jgi:hypothetical protein
MSTVTSVDSGASTSTSSNDTYAAPVTGSVRSWRSAPSQVADATIFSASARSYRPASSTTWV